MEAKDALGRITTAQYDAFGDAETRTGHGVVCPVRE
jgi:hypothetical protein